MEGFHLKTWQLVLLAIVYITYLCWALLGGMKKKKVKPIVYIAMTLLMIYGLIKECNGIGGMAELINIPAILIIGFMKGIYLGHKKIVEKTDGVWYIHHDKKYIAAWFAFFIIKLAFTQILKTISGADIPLWHMILYFCFYYPWRTINIFIANPKMRREILKK